MRTVLVIDDNPGVGTALEMLFGLHDITTLTAASPQAGLVSLAAHQVDLVIADMNFSADTTSGQEGLALFRDIRARYPDMPVILLTAWTHLESAVQLVKAGAADYVAKPWDNDRLLSAVENLLELSESVREAARLHLEREQQRSRLAKTYDLCGVVYASQAMASAVELACRVARADVPVLITGPNGSGKERIAAIVHANSAVRAGPFVVVNCGALPAELIEAELFGAEAGAFTGALRARVGRFESADGGTLFLDEIGNLPLSGQVKLLRVLESGQFEPLGSSRTRTTRVRVISATNAELPQMIRQGVFREDLFYRLNTIEIPLPALAARPADILPLAQHFLGPELTLGDDARRALLQHGWPGNVRELRNVVERARLLAGSGELQVRDLNLPAAKGPGTLAEEALNRSAIEASLQAAGGNVSRAAASLGLSRQALYRRMERLGLRS